MKKPATKHSLTITVNYGENKDVEYDYRGTLRGAYARATRMFPSWTSMVVTIVRGKPDDGPASE
jgi:hypothetical protein